MATRFWLSLSLSALMTGSATAQSVQSVLQTTATAMGMENLTSIEYSGTGWQGRVGQNVAPDRDWPRVELTSYTRTIDFVTMSSKEEYVREGSTRQFTISSAGTTPGPWTRRDNRFRSRPPPSCGGSRSS